MTLPGGQEPFDAAEIRFKNGRKEFFRNTEKLTLAIGDIVATEASPGHDIGIVTLTGELVKIQMKKKGENPENKIKSTKVLEFENYGHFCLGDMHTREFPELVLRIYMFSSLYSLQKLLIGLKRITNRGYCP
jgi:hypothetical protein